MRAGEGYRTKHSVHRKVAVIARSWGSLPEPAPQEQQLHSAAPGLGPGELYPAKIRAAT